MCCACPLTFASFVQNSELAAQLGDAGGFSLCLHSIVLPIRFVVTGSEYLP